MLLTDLADNRDYNNAKAYCVGQGGNLATLKNDEQYNLVLNAADAAGRERPHRDS